MGRSGRPRSELRPALVSTEEHEDRGATAARPSLNTPHLKLKGSSPFLSLTSPLATTQGTTNLSNRPWNVLATVARAAWYSSSLQRPQQVLLMDPQGLGSEWEGTVAWSHLSARQCQPSFATLGVCQGG